MIALHQAGIVSQLLPKFLFVLACPCNICKHLLSKTFREVLLDDELTLLYLILVVFRYALKLLHEWPVLPQFFNQTSTGILIPQDVCSDELLASL